MRRPRLQEALDDAAHVGLAVGLALSDGNEIHLRGAGVSADTAFAWGAVGATLTGVLAELLALDPTSHDPDLAPDEQALIRRHIADPLGLVLAPATTAHDRKGRPVPVPGGCSGSVRDLLQWVRAVGGEAPEPVATALTRSCAPRTRDRLAERGLGWSLSAPGGPAGLRAPRPGETAWVWAEGLTAGSSAFVAHDPVTGRGVAVLSSSARSVTPLGVELLRR